MISRRACNQCVRIGGLAFLVLLLTACSARVTGYVSPIAHDYGSVEWMPLTQVVVQPFVAGPGQQAAIANDGQTTPRQLQERLAALPGDAGNGTLEELAVGLRLEGRGEPEQVDRWNSGARVQLVYDPERDLRFPEREFTAWPEDETWLPDNRGGIVAEQSFVSPYPMLSGISVRVATFGGDLSPGDAVAGPDGVELRSLPIFGDVNGQLEPGATVRVTSASEGWASVELPDGDLGWAPFDAFASLPEPQRRLRYPVVVTLADDAGNEIRRVTTEPQWIRDNSHHVVEFEPLPDSAGRRYTFTVSIAAPQLHLATGLTVRVTTSDVYPEGEASSGNDVVFRPLYSEASPIFDVAVDDLPRDGDWLRIEDQPSIGSGHVVSLRLVPGDGPDAELLRYGVTPDRAPYGGWVATGEHGDGAGGALLVRTIYERNVEAWPLVTGILRNLRGAAQDDLIASAAWALALAGLLATAGWVWRMRPVREG